MATKKHKRARTGEYDVNRSDVWAGGKYLGKVPIGTSLAEAKKRFPGAMGVSSPACLGLRKGDTIDQLGRTRCAPKGGRKGGGGLAAFPIGGQSVRQGLAANPFRGAPNPFIGMFKASSKKPSKKPARRKGADASKVQSVGFARHVGVGGSGRVWTEKAAKKWAKEHGFRYGKVEQSKNYFWLRQFEPDKKRYNYRTIKFGPKRQTTTKGILARVAFPKHVALGRLPPRFRLSEGAPAHIMREVEEQLLRRAA